MTKIVLKKSEVLKSARPIVIQPLEEKIQTISLDNLTPPQNLYSSPFNIMDLAEDEKQENTEISHTQDNNEHKESIDDLKLAIDESREKAQSIISDAEIQSEKILAQANTTKDNIIAEAEIQANNLKQNIDQEIIQAKETGKQEGLTQGLEEAQTENKRLITLLQKITVDLVNEKSKILDTIESDIVDLILMISSKVVKSITAQYKQVVLDNVIAAIKKLKVHNNLIVKVNPDDLYTIQEYKSNILTEINGIENIQFLEDPSIEMGGCVIQSDFGSVDGRISSQLAEIEEQIRKISPIKPL